MKDKDAHLMMEALREAVDPETGQRMSPKAKAKHIQWQNDLKAQIKQASERGDQDKADKLQYYLDTHGIDEADDQPYDGMDDQHQRAEDEHQNLLNVRAAFGGKDFIGWAGDKMREIGKDTFEAKWNTFIQGLEGDGASPDNYAKRNADAKTIRMPGWYRR